MGPRHQGHLRGRPRPLRAVLGALASAFFATLPYAVQFVRLPPHGTQARTGSPATAPAAAALAPPVGPPVLTYYGINTYALEIGGRRLLVDPILTGDLVFFGQRWAFSGSRREASRRAGVEPRLVPELFDCIVLSQGLEDHTHPATLAEIDRGVPIVASPAAARVARGLGFASVTSLAPGESCELGPHLRITALPGSVVGPPWDAPENGYVFADLRPGGLSIGAEPHGNFLGPALGTSLRLLPRDPRIHIDALLVPLTAQDVGGYRLVNGPTEAVATLEALQTAPRYVLPLRNSEIDAAGVMAAVMREEGSPNEFARLLHQHPRLSEVRILDIMPGSPVRIE